ncbi:hypothetical protein FBZ96_104481 [Bradyrhizobium stylosanthis]|uniref:Uncharacterized protein n=1 Tax=Bradyrhizobium stylosanthis TaxID=1803665 RepID=A0A560DQW0_9BRAD|nr:hypothetical protein FBZ96_104481 [Bradyrhizobium stylosanthis]
MSVCASARSKATKQSRLFPRKILDCFATLAMTSLSKRSRASPSVVMPGLDPGIHVFPRAQNRVDGRVKPGHDGRESPSSQLPQKFTRFEIAPSTTRLDPVVNPDTGLARNTAALAISCGVAMRPVGLRFIASL